MPNRRPPSRSPARSSPGRPQSGRSAAGGRPSSRPQQGRATSGQAPKRPSTNHSGAKGYATRGGGTQQSSGSGWRDASPAEVRRGGRHPGEQARSSRRGGEDVGFADQSPRGRRPASSNDRRQHDRPHPNSPHPNSPRQDSRFNSRRHDDTGYADFGHDIGDYDFRDDYDIQPAGYDEGDHGFDHRARRSPPTRREAAYAPRETSPTRREAGAPRREFPHPEFTAASNQPQGQGAGILLRLPAGTAPLADRRLRRLSSPTFWLKQKDYDLLFLPRAAYKETMRWPFLSQALECLIYGRFKLSDQQLEQLATACRRRAKLWSLQLTVDGNHFVRQSWERWLVKALSDHGVRMVAAGTPAADKAETLFVMAIEDAYYIGVQRFQADQLPHRAARKVERAGALPPEIAGAMVELAYLQPGERLLDPVCGSGTLLIEAAAVQPDLTLYGYDSDHKAIQAASKNLATIVRDPAKRELSVVDSREPRLPAASVDVILANLPFGVQFGDTATNQALYEAFFAAWTPLLSPTGRMVVLTADHEALNAALQAVPVRQRRLRLDRKLRVRVKGIWAEMALLKL